MHHPLHAPYLHAIPKPLTFAAVPGLRAASNGRQVPEQPGRRGLSSPKRAHWWHNRCMEPDLPGLHEGELGYSEGTPAAQWEIQGLWPDL